MQPIPDKGGGGIILSGPGEKARKVILTGPTLYFTSLFNGIN